MSIIIVLNKDAAYCDCVGYRVPGWFSTVAASSEAAIFGGDTSGSVGGYYFHDMASVRTARGKKQRGRVQQSRIQRLDGIRS
jgi:hypothetical protein